jgi:hypothetical protein
MGQKFAGRSRQFQCSVSEDVICFLDFTSVETYTKENYFFFLKMIFNPEPPVRPILLPANPIFPFPLI